jgi:hypothetical protein
MTGTMSRVTLNVTVACCVLAGCGTDDEPPVDAAAIAVDTAAGDSVFDPAEDLVTLPTSRIYYTLTSYDWYARGEPLVFDGRPWEPEGTPVSASLNDMEKAGEYQGVEFYVRAGDPGAVVYVPVFDGYWQRFRADPNATAMPADADVDDTDTDGADDAAAADTSAALR